MSHPPRRRALTVIATASLIGAFAVSPAAAAPGDPDGFTATAVEPSGKPIDTAKSARAQLAKSDPALLKSTSARRTTVMVKLDYDAAAGYAGGVDGLAATSPKVTGKQLDTGDSAVKKYLRYADRQSAAAAKAIEKAVPSADVTGTFNVAYGGLAVTLPENQAKALLALPGVAAVQQDSVEQLQVATTGLAAAASTGLQNGTTKFVGAEKVWKQLGGRDHAGEGVVVGVLDSGIWPEHPMMKDLGLETPEGGPWACEFGDGTDPELGPAYDCTNKLVGAYAFLDTALAQGAVGDDEYCDLVAKVCSARDSDGHGTHTATTAAGTYTKMAELLGVDRGPVAGVAPGASVIAYRVCSESGCYSSDSVAAVQQAILDGVEVINFSISGGNSAYTDPVELAFLDAYDAGISVNASAGNDGPGAGTANHASPWVTTVGASTSNREFGTDLVLTADNGDTFTKDGVTVTDGVTDGPVVLAQSVAGYTGTDLCSTPFPAGSVEGKVVACKRGGNARVEKGYNALQGGAIGMILYNPTASDVETDNHFLPTVHLEGPNDELLAFLGSHTGVTATWTEGQVRAAKGDVMAGFSSRGPLGEFLKPDVTSVGVQVLAGNTPTPVALASGPPGQLFQAIAGTSMSSPHSAGVSALVRAAHPSWTPGQVKSALMTSSVQDVTNVDGSVAGVFDRGAGSIRADRAVKPSVTFDVKAADYVASATDPLHRVDLNLPSVQVNPLPGAVTTTRAAKNVTGRTQSFTVRTTAADGLKITVTPQRFTLKPGKSQKLTILLDGTATTEGWHSGQITLKTSGSSNAVLPVAVKTGAAEVTLDQSCTPTEITRDGLTTCTVTATNFAAVAAPATVKVTSSDKLPVTQVSAPARRSGTGAVWTGTLSPAIAPTITSIEPGESPAGGYLPLSAFGIAPATGFGDETIRNFSVPAFKYGDETYTSIGVDSNGYVVVGGGTAEDNDCCNPQTFPSTARPNNVLAPYWTDLSLDPATGGGEIRVGTLTDGVDTWLVVDYAAVRAFGSTAANTFQVWIQTGDTEGQWFSYGTLGGPNGQPLSVGAENRDGTSGVNVASVASDTEYAITTEGPTAGGSVSFTYKAKGLKKGTHTLTATLTTPILRTTPIAKDTITVIR